MEFRHARSLAPVAAGLLIPLVAACGSKAPPPHDPATEEVEIGYGSRDRSDVTGSVSSLTEDDFGDDRVARVEELIANRVAGVQVNRRADGTLAFRIRGTRSFVGNNEPLVVIDGVPLSARTVTLALQGIAPQNIDRIDVLKDAGSTAAYGSRGANGVILITTKRGDSR